MIASWTDASLTMLGFAIIMFLKTTGNSLNINEQTLDGCVDPFQNPYFSLFFLLFFCLECCR